MTTADSRLLHLLTRPPRLPLLQLTIYFAGLLAVGALLVAFVPVVGDVIVSGPSSRGAEAGGLRDLLTERPLQREAYLLFDLRMLIVMMGTFLVAIPVSWGYMAIRERTGYEQSVAQTLVVLPVVVAGIMIVIQNSLALAFALGGVAAAVRFRNTLKDVADATYVFLAIGLGIAAGSGALTGALVMAAMFTYVSIFLWGCNYGLCLMPPASNVMEPSADDEQERPPRIRGEVIVDVRDDAARTALEAVLAASAKRWKLRRSSRSDTGARQLHYEVQLKRSSTLEATLEALHSESGTSVPAPRFVPRDVARK